MTSLLSVSAPALNAFTRQQTERRAEQAEQQAKALENQASAKRREARQANEEAKRFDSEARQADSQANNLRTNLTAAERLEQGTAQNRNNLFEAIQNKTAPAAEQNKNPVQTDNIIGFDTFFSPSGQQNTALIPTDQSRLGQQINLFI
ncbi:hypothetical protein [Arsukibacterium sp.]|uniref:hypothetical protein n=1 Tax=Arsukibacterium sp. TaxID=1977258 RepID=UPI002FD96ACC